MALSHIIHGLAKKRAQIVAELQYHEARAAACRSAIKHMDATMALYMALYDEAKNAPVVRKRHFVNPRIFPHGHMSRMVMDVMREAGEPMMAREIATALIASQGLQETAPGSARKLYQRIGAVLNEKRKQGIVRAAGEIGARVRWEIVPLE